MRHEIVYFRPTQGDTQAVRLAWVIQQDRIYSMIPSL